MRRSIPVFLLIIGLVISVNAQAQQGMSNHEHSMGTPTTDLVARHVVNFPPAIQTHFLANMRDHLKALAEILTAMSSGQYAKASKIADARLGLHSPGAKACTLDGKKSNTQNKPMKMDMGTMMHQFMPPDMQKLGLAMHKAASQFAAEAEKASKNGNGKPAFAALAHMTQRCVACHAAFRIR